MTRPLVIVCPSAEDTRRLGMDIGAACRDGLIIALYGDLGCGKTTLVQGLAAGLDVPAGYRITSPSYTLVNEYPGRIDLAHADLYRLSGETALDDVGLEDLLDGAAVVAVEWPQRMGPRALADHLSVHFTVGDDDARQIRLTAYGLAPSNLLKAVSTIYS